MTELQRLLKANEDYARSFRQGYLPIPPARKLAILACMDARLSVKDLLGLETGDAHVIRNAGGIATDDAIRSLIISHELLGTREVLVINHTDCGMLTFEEPQLRGKLEKKYQASAEGIDFYPFSDLKDNLRRQVKKIRSSPFIPKEIPVYGFIFDVKTARLERVV